MNNQATLDRILARVDKTDTCWLWQGPTNGVGYGSTSVGGKKRVVHRALYELLVRAIPPGLILDHLCRVRSCCNPDHLEPVTHKINSERGANSLKAAGVCRNGHDVTKPGSITRKGGQNRCRECLRGAKRGDTPNPYRAVKYDLHTARFDDDLWAAVKARANREGTSVSAIIRQGLRDYVEGGDAA